MQLFNLTSTATTAALVLVASTVTAAATAADEYSSGIEGILIPYKDDAPLSRVQIAAVSKPMMMEGEGDGVYTTCLPIYGGANATDCEAAIANIASNTNDLGVAPGFCLQWWVGTCSARICATSQPEGADAYWEKPAVIASRLGGDALDVCINKGDSGVVGDCVDYAAQGCGVFRYYLERRQ